MHTYIHNYSQLENCPPTLNLLPTPLWLHSPSQMGLQFIKIIYITAWKINYKIESRYCACVTDFHRWQRSLHHLSQMLNITFCVCQSLNWWTEYLWQRNLHQLFQVLNIRLCICQSLNWWAWKEEYLERSHLLSHPLRPLILNQSTVNGKHAWNNFLPFLFYFTILRMFTYLKKIWKIMCVYGRIVIGIRNPIKLDTALSITYEITLETNLTDAL